MSLAVNGTNLLDYLVRNPRAAWKFVERGFARSGALELHFPIDEAIAAAEEFARVNFTGCGRVDQSGVLAVLRIQAGRTARRIAMVAESRFGTMEVSGVTLLETGPCDYYRVVVRRMWSGVATVVRQGPAVSRWGLN